MPQYIDEIECTCGGYVSELCGIDFDGDEDEIIRTVKGVCTKCGKEYIYKERYKLLGFYDIKEK
jgi:hypothetical protein